jgi:hypothetical protein
MLRHARVRRRKQTDQSDVNLRRREVQNLLPNVVVGRRQDPTTRQNLSLRGRRPMIVMIEKM